MRNWTGTQNRQLLQRVVINGPAGTAARVTLQRPAQMVMVSVKTGAIDVFLGSSGNVGDTPDYHFGQTNRPEWVPFFGGCSEFVIVASDTVHTTVANVQFGGE